MNLTNHRMVTIIQKLPAFWIALVLLCLTQGVKANPATNQIDDIRFVPCGDGCVRIEITGNGDITPEAPAFIGNPSRIIIDFKDTVLNYNDGRTRRIPIDITELNSIGISQYQRHPDVVRLVMNFKSGDEKTILKMLSSKVENGKIAFTYSTGSVEIPSSDITPDNGYNKIVNLLHQRVGPQRDRFTIKGSNNLPEPSVRFVSGGLLLTFKNSHFETPAGTDTKGLNVPVSGTIIDEIQIINLKDSATLFLRVKDSARSDSFDYTVKWNDDLSLDFDVMRSLAPAIEIDKPEPKPIRTDEGKVKGMVHVLGSSIDSSGFSDSSASAKIVRIQYHPLSIGERFIIEVLGDFKPEFQKLRYPDRIILTAQNTSVLLPKEAKDRFQIKIDGAISKLMKVFLADRDGMPESAIQFYYELTENEDVQYNFYASENANVYYLDLIPIAVALRTEPSALIDTTPKPFGLTSEERTEQAETPQSPKVIEPVKTPVSEEPSKVEVESIPCQTIEKTNDQPASTFSFDIPESPIEYVPVINIPKSDYSSDETESTEPEKAEMVIESAEIMSEPHDEGIHEESVVSDEPVEAISDIVSDEVDPLSIDPDNHKFAPIRVEYITDGTIDKFILTSDDPIDQYSHNELNYPSRLAMEFPGREIDFDNLESGITRNVKGKVADNVRIIDRDQPDKRSIFYVYLNDSWENIDFTMSSSPNRMTIQIVSLVPDEVVETAVADASSATVREGFVTPDITKVEPGKSDIDVTEVVAVVIPKVEPVKAEEEKPQDVKLESKEEPVKFEVNEPEVIAVEEKEEPQTTGFSFLVDRKPQDTPSEAKTEEIEEIESYTIPIVEKVIEVEEEPIETIEFTLEPETEESVVSVVEEVIIEAKEDMVEKSGQTKSEDEDLDAFIKMNLKEDPVTEEAEILTTIAKSTDFPLKVGERIIPDNSIRLVEMREGADFGEIIIEVSGNFIPDPDINWWSYPSRISFNFEGLGVNINDESVSRWEKDIHTEAVNKLRVLQHSGGRVSLAASMELYLNPGFERSSMDIEMIPVGNNRMKISLLKPGHHYTEDVHPGKPLKDAPVIEITDEDFTLGDLEKTDADSEVPSFTPKHETTGTGRYIQSAKVDTETPEFVEYDDQIDEPLITVILQNAEIEDVLFLIAEHAGLDISVQSRSIRGTISLKVTRKPVSEVFDLIATQGNFMWNNYKGTYIFGSEDFIWDVPGVIQTQVVRLKYADPLRVRQVLTQLRIGSPRSITLYQAATIGRGGVGQVPTAQSAVVLKGDTNQIGDMMSVIRALDIPPLLIKVNMKVIEYSVTEETNFGFDWRISSQGSATEGSDKGFIAFNLREKQPENVALDNLPVPWQGFRRSGLQEVDLIINFLEDKGDAKILADSTLTVTNGGEGNFFVGEQVPYRSTFQISDFGRVTQRIQTEDIGITLQFRAQATEDGMITLYLDPDIRNLKEITDIGPRTSQKRFSTTIRMESGQPYAIGGLISETERASYNKVPFVGDLPLVGKLFQSKKKQQVRSEIIVVITPEIIHDKATQRYTEIYDMLDDEGISFSLN